MVWTRIRKHSSGNWLWERHGLTPILLGTILGFCLSGPVQGRSNTSPQSPVKISEVVISPDPFLIGKSPVTFSMVVELPPTLNGANVLEVSALIASPTKRSMSFVSHRRLLSQESPGRGGTSVPIMLVWDGKDQYHNLVQDGSYYYEIRAKLMEDGGFGPRTKIVSHRVQGTLDVLAYAGEVLPPAPPEPVLPDELPEEQPEVTPDGPGSPDNGEELLLEDVQVVEEGLKASDEPVNPSAEGSGDAVVPDHQNYPQALPEIPEEKKAGEVNETVLPGGTGEGHPAQSIQEPLRSLEHQPPTH